MLLFHRREEPSHGAPSCFSECLPYSFFDCPVAACLRALSRELHTLLGTAMIRKVKRSWA